MVAVEGWARTTRMSALDLGNSFEDAGVSAHHLHRHFARRHSHRAQHRDRRWRLANALSIPVIASGGLASLADIERLLQPDCAKLAGAITGRALYDGRLDPKQALALIRKARAS